MVRLIFVLKNKIQLIFVLGGFQSSTGNDGRSGYNPRGAYPPNGSRGGIYPIQPLPPLVDVSGLNARYTNAALLTSTRVS